MLVKTIGITGGIGSGKSFICRIFKEMDIPIYNSDFHAKRLMIESDQIINNIKDLLGKKAYDVNGQLNRKFISKIIFNDSSVREQLNKIVHPVVRKDFKQYAERQITAGAPYVINEAALFVENGSYKDFDRLVSVVAPERLRIERLKKRDGSSEDEIRERMRSQSSDAKKISLSHHVIYNDVCENLFSQIGKIHKEVITFTKKKDDDRN